MTVDEREDKAACSQETARNSRHARICLLRAEGEEDFEE